MTSKKISKAQIKRNRKAWLEALRSGKFKQTTGKLKSRNGAYCCLGVACEVAGIPSVYQEGEYLYGDPDILKALTDPKWDGMFDNALDYVRYDSTSLPPIAQEWLGVTDSGPRLAKPIEVRPGVMETSLIELNDNYGWSFEQIADAVEKYGLAE
jgi:hypothetical protein